MRALVIIVVLAGLVAGITGCGGGGGTIPELGIRVERYNPATRDFRLVLANSAQAGLFRVTGTEPGATVVLVSGNGSGVPGEPRGFNLRPGEAVFQVSLPDGRTVTRTILVTENTTPVPLSGTGVFRLQQIHLLALFPRHRLFLI